MDVKKWVVFLRTIGAMGGISDLHVRHRTKKEVEVELSQSECGSGITKRAGSGRARRIKVSNILQNEEDVVY